jgi:hypothetical protein
VDNRYWAAIEDPAEFGAALKDVIEGNSQAAIVQKIKSEQQGAFLHSYAISFQDRSSSSRILRDGQEGELATFRVPIANALANAVVALVTNNKVTWDCKAANADANSRAQTTIGNNACDYYWHDRGVEGHTRDVTNEATRFGECFTFIEYDPTAGEMTVPPDSRAGNNQVIPGAEAQSFPAQANFEGDARFHLVSSWDAVRDPYSKSYEDCDWLSIRLRRNRFDLAARFGPEVLDACSDPKKGILGNTASEAKVKSDLVDCWYWFHRRTPAMPEGRQCVVIGDKAFELQPLQYREIPVARLASGKIAGTPFPFAPFWTALASQEVQDALYSAIVTNNLNLGAQMIAAQAGSDIEPSSFGPMQLVTYPVGGKPPEALQLVQSAPESFKLLEKIQADQKQLLGLNNTALGQPEGANLSGAAMALLSSMASQANSSFQAAYAEYVKQVGNIFMHIVQDFFTIERKIKIAGKSASYMVTEQPFSSESVSDISTVSVRIGNPVAQTVAGREAIFDKLKQAQLELKIPIMSTAEDVQQLLETGRIEGITDDKRDQALLVEAENEALSRGEPQVALLGDDDIYHCKHHRSVVTSIEARNDPALLNVVLEHVHQHYENYFGVPAEGDPLYRENMMLLFGITVPQAPGMIPPAGTPEGSEAESPMPSMPTNPLTGQEFDTQTGGGVVAPPGEGSNV